MRTISLLVIILLSSGTIFGQTPTASDSTKGQKKDLYVVGTAHLDTQWRWTIKNTINEYVPATFRDNFTLMDKFPHYTFSFEGAFRYMLLKEYYPDLYERAKKYIDDGRWRVAGSWVDAVDVNMPSFESLVRHALYGNGFFKEEFGKTSRDILLPDCFGFGYALPSIAAHCGLKSFSTQKLTWGSSVGVPFDIGIWEGVDGSALAAALNPGDYVSRIKDDLSRDTSWENTINRDGEKYGLYAAYRYFGTGDTGGAPDSSSVEWLEKSIDSDGPVKVHSIGSDDLADIVASSDSTKLPHYCGELLMKRHGVGCYTSEAAMKRWNRKNELLADAAERAAVIANYLTGSKYPRQELRDTWIRFLWHQFHDDLTGTSLPEAYQYSWSDEILCQNRFAGILEHAVEGTSPMFDTHGKGVPLLVFNPLSIDREDMVEATVVYDSLHPIPNNVEVIGPDGKITPCQVDKVWKDSIRVIFLARVPSVGYSVYEVRPLKEKKNITSALKVTSSSLENERYLVTLNANGDVSSMYDKTAKRECLAEPMVFQLLDDKPARWPSWEIQYEDITAAPRAIIEGQPEVKIIENGPARVALEVTRKTDKLALRTIIRLSAGEAGNRVEFANNLDWYERGTLLKAAFRFATPNDSVTYDLGLGTIKRGINKPELYEVPAHQWADMTSSGGDYGVAVLNDCKYGWDHPDSSTLRLSLVHTPAVGEDWSWVSDQGSQDNGHHEFLFAVVGHEGDWRKAGIPWQGARVNQPLLSFQTAPHKGVLGKSFSLVNIADKTDSTVTKSKNDNPGVMINAVKLAERSDDIVLRFKELNGQLETANVSIIGGVVGARKIDGAENPLDSLKPGDKNSTELNLQPYQPIALEIKPMEFAKKSNIKAKYAVLALPYNMDGISMDANRKDGDFDGSGNTLAGELVPDTIIYQGVPFIFGPKDQGALNVVMGKGQTLDIPQGGYNRLYILASAVGGPAEGEFTLQSLKSPVTSVQWVQDYATAPGQWNNRLVGGGLTESAEEIDPAYINRAPIGWYGSHRHTAASENDAYQFTYAYLIRLNIDRATTVKLPDNPNIRVLAASAVKSNYDDIRPAQALYDVTNNSLAIIHASRKTFLDSLVISLSSPICGGEIRCTTDGSTPTMQSAAYRAPITMKQTTTFKAAAFLAGADNHITSVTYEKLIPHEPVQVDSVAPGLNCQYYEGSWTKLPDFDTLKVIKKAVVDSVAIPSFAQKEDYGLVLTGYVEVPREGLYTFYVNSDDGSSMRVADSLFIDNDGIHGDNEVSGEIALKAGLHKIEVHMFQAKGGQALGASIEGPDMPKQPIQKGMIFHEVVKKGRGRTRGH